MPDQKIIIKKLEAANLDQVSRFRMLEGEEKPLEIFIRRKAHKSAAANLTQTYIAKVENTRPVIGYISMMCAEIKLEKAYEIGDKPDADRYDYQPAVRISRLAVEKDYRGRKLGRELVKTAIGIILLSIVPNIGCRFLNLDAKHKSISFYERLGFRLLDTPDNRESATPLMFMDLRGLIDEVDGNNAAPAK